MGFGQQGFRFPSSLLKVMHVRLRNDAGMVTAEAAMIMPAFALLAFFIAWVCAVGVWQLRLEDAVRSLTRAATMHVQESELNTQLQQRLPKATMKINDLDSRHVKVTISHPVVGPGILPDLILRAEAVGLRETNE